MALTGQEQTDKVYRTLRQIGNSNVCPGDPGGGRRLGAREEVWIIGSLAEKNRGKGG